MYWNLLRFYIFGLNILVLKFEWFGEELLSIKVLSKLLSELLVKTETCEDVFFVFLAYSEWLVNENKSAIQDDAWNSNESHIRWSNCYEEMKFQKELKLALFLY